MLVSASQDIAQEDSLRNGLFCAKQENVFMGALMSSFLWRYWSNEGSCSLIFGEDYWTIEIADSGNRKLSCIWNRTVERTTKSMLYMVNTGSKYSHDMTRVCVLMGGLAW